MTSEYTWLTVNDFNQQQCKYAKTEYQFYQFEEKIAWDTSAHGTVADNTWRNLTCFLTWEAPVGPGGQVDQIHPPKAFQIDWWYDLLVIIPCKIVIELEEICNSCCLLTMGWLQLYWSNTNQTGILLAAAAHEAVRHSHWVQSLLQLSENETIAVSIFKQ